MSEYSENGGIEKNWHKPKVWTTGLDCQRAHAHSVAGARASPTLLIIALTSLALASVRTYCHGQSWTVARC